jgi:hypothetical protein
VAAVDLWGCFNEISRFFAGRSQVHRAMHRLILNLEKANIPYVIVGGLAVNAHGHRQTTRDVDVLLAPEGLAHFQERLGGIQYIRAATRRRRFLDRQNGTPVDIVLSGARPGWLRPSPIVYPNPAATETMGRARYINLRALIELKLAIGRYQDLGDVAALIRVHDLDESFAQRLHPSVRGDYIECLEEKRREDEYEAREG